jgi:hypothetical protein
MRSGGADLCRVLNVLLQKSSPGINLSRTGPAVTDRAGQSTANDGKSSISVAFGVTSGPAAITSARPRRCNKSLLLAGSGGSEEDRPVLKK